MLLQVGADCSSNGRGSTLLRGLEEEIAQLVHCPFAPTYQPQQNIKFP